MTADITELAACAKMKNRQPTESGGHARNRTGVHGFAGRCVTTPPRGHYTKMRHAISKQEKQNNLFILFNANFLFSIAHNRISK